MDCLPRFSALLATLVAGALPAPAALLIDPSGGTVLVDDSTFHSPDTIVPGSVTLGGEFFGLPFSGWTPHISLHGNINFSENSDSSGTLGSEQRSRIAPLWTELSLGFNSGARIVENIGDAYYAVSWLNLTTMVPGGGAFTFQGVFFTDDTTINGIDFYANDIVFGYADTSAGIGYEQLLSVGLSVYVEDYQTGTFATFGNAYGTFSDETKNLIPTGAGEYVLFRPDGSGPFGGYDVSIATSAVPEPSSYATLLGYFALAGVFATRRRRRGSIGV